MGTARATACISLVCLLSHLAASSWPPVPIRSQFRSLSIQRGKDSKNSTSVTCSSVSFSWVEKMQIFPSLLWEVHHWPRLHDTIDRLRRKDIGSFVQMFTALCPRLLWCVYESVYHGLLSLLRRRLFTPRVPALSCNLVSLSVWDAMGSWTHRNQNMWIEE